MVLHLRIFRLADDVCLFRVDDLLRVSVPTLELSPFLPGIPSSARDINDEADTDFCENLNIKELVMTAI